MLAKIITLLLALGVSASGVAAISTATNHIRQVNTPTHANGPPVTDRLAMAKQHAAAAAANGLARAQAAKANGTHDTTGKPSLTGTARAAEAITAALDKAPVAADDGLNRALSEVTSHTSGAPASLPAPATNHPTPPPHP